MTLLGRHTQWGLDLVSTRDDWRHRAACSPETADLFWPPDRTRHDQGRPLRLTADGVAAIRLCLSCPVRRQCLEHELAAPVQPFTRIAAGRVFTTRGTSYVPELPPAPLLSPNDPRHGSVNAYQEWRCRCVPCRQAYASKQAVRHARDRQRKRDAFALQHGGAA